MNDQPNLLLLAQFYVNDKFINDDRIETYKLMVIRVIGVTRNQMHAFISICVNNTKLGNFTKNMSSLVKRKASLTNSLIFRTCDK